MIITIDWWDKNAILRLENGLFLCSWEGCPDTGRGDVPDDAVQAQERQRPAPACRVCRPTVWWISTCDYYIEADLWCEDN